MRQLVTCVVALPIILLTLGAGPAHATDGVVTGEDLPPYGALPAGCAGGSNVPPGYPEYGVDDLIVYNIPGFAFSNLRDAQHGRSSPGSYLYNSGGTSNTYDATFHLPSGAVISGVTPYIYDADPSANVEVYIYRLDYHGYPPAPSSTNLLTVSSSGDDGYWFFYTPLPVPEVVRNGYPPTFSTFYYLVVVSLDPSGSAFDLTFGGLTIWYKLQVSPAPASASFTDVPTGHPFFQYVEALADSGITAGCGGGMYCPDSPVTRGQMAVFLAKALGLHWAY